MFKDRFQGKIISVYYSVGSQPLADWLVQCKEGDLRTVQDNEIKSNVLQILSTNVVACSVTTPVDPRGSLRVQLPYLTLQIKNLGRYFTFEVTVMDTECIRRRFRASNYQTAMRTSMFATSLPLRMRDGWNQVQFNLAQYTERTYGTSYAETVRVTVHANCRMRRVFFSDRLYENDALPAGFPLINTPKPRDKRTRVAGKPVSAKTVSAKTASANKTVTPVTRADPVAVETEPVAAKVTGDTEPKAVEEAAEDTNAAAEDTNVAVENTNTVVEDTNAAAKEMEVAVEA